MTAFEESGVSDDREEPRIGAVPGRLVYPGALVLSAALLVVTGITEVLPWPAAILGVAALGATRIEATPWLALAGGVLFAVITVGVGLSGVGDAGYAERLASQPETAAIQPPAPDADAGSLGLRLEEISGKWNALEQPPAITGGLIRETESGPYDSFRYRFDKSAVLAGAFDREDGSVHALMGSVGLSHEAAPNFYLHLCFMLHPYSQDCIDSYFEEGLAGKQLPEYAGVDHRAQWELGDQLWKLEISGDVQTIRVLSESAR